MKPSTFSSLLALMIPAMAIAQTSPADTVKVIPNANTISVIKEGNKTIVTATIPTDDGTGSFNKYTYEVDIDHNHQSDRDAEVDDIMLKLPFMKNEPTDFNKEEGGKWKARRYITGLKYAYWGWNFNYDSKAGIKNCYELSIADIIGIDWCTSRKTTLGIGLGFGFNRVTSDEHMLFVKEGDVLSLRTAPENAEVDFARWDTWRIQVPLMYSQKLAGKFGFSLATIINFNTYSTATNRYRLDRTRYTETIKGLNQRLLTVDLMATIGIVNDIGVYAKWSPMTAMEQKYGPSFRNFSIGINLNF